MILPHHHHNQKTTLNNNTKPPKMDYLNQWQKHSIHIHHNLYNSHAKVLKRLSEVLQEFIINKHNSYSIRLEYTNHLPYFLILSCRIYIIIGHDLISQTHIHMQKWKWVFIFMPYIHTYNTCTKTVDTKSVFKFAHSFCFTTAHKAKP